MDKTNPPESRENQGTVYRNDERRGRPDRQGVALFSIRAAGRGGFSARWCPTWIADFIDGHGELVESSTWFASSAPRPRRRRHGVHGLEAMPLPAELVERIERLLAASLEPAQSRRPGDRFATKPGHVARTTVEARRRSK